MSHALKRCLAGLVAGVALVASAAALGQTSVAVGAAVGVAFLRQTPVADA